MATYEGMGLCEPHEYRAAFASRLTHDQLTRGELYVARFAIEGLPKAYRVLGRMGVVSALNGVCARVEFQLLNDDLRPLAIPPAGLMTHGAWNPLSGLAYDEKPGVLPQRDMRDGYLGRYDDGMGFDLEVMMMLERERDLTPS